MTPSFVVQNIQSVIDNCGVTLQYKYCIFQGVCIICLLESLVLWSH